MVEPLKANRVLIVEDEYFIAADLAQVLQSEGAVVVGPICDLSDALNRAAQGGFDAAVIDINLNEEPAYCVADKLIEHRIPFVFGTSYSKESLPNRFCEVERFEKPYDLPIIAKRVMQLCRQRRRPQ